MPSRDGAPTAPEQGNNDLVDQPCETDQAVSKGTQRVCLEGSAPPGSQYCEQDDGYESDEWVIYCRQKGIKL